MVCPECERLAAEAERLRKEYQAALIRLHRALDTLTASTLEYEKSKSDANITGQKYDLVRLELEKHRRTHLQAVKR